MPIGENGFVFLSVGTDFYQNGEIEFNSFQRYVLQQPPKTVLTPFLISDYICIVSSAGTLDTCCSTLLCAQLWYSIKEVRPSMMMFVLLPSAKVDTGLHKYITVWRPFNEFMIFYFLNPSTRAVPITINAPSIIPQVLTCLRVL